MSGNRGEVKVSITVKVNAIKAVHIDKQDETEGISAAAFKKLRKRQNYLVLISHIILML